MPHHLFSRLLYIHGQAGIFSDHKKGILYRSVLLAIPILSDSIGITSVHLYDCTGKEYFMAQNHDGDAIRIFLGGGQVQTKATDFETSESIYYNN